MYSAYCISVHVVCKSYEDLMDVRCTLLHVLVNIY
jgi:hypothetical protein